MAAGILYDTSTTDASNTAFAGNSTDVNVAKPSDARKYMQAWQGATKRWLTDLGGTAVVSGTNTILVTLNQAFTAYGTSTGQIPNGAIISIKPVAANTSAATLNINSIGAKAIRLQGDSALVGAEMALGGIYLLRYDTAYNSAAGAWVLLNPAVTAPVNAALTSNDLFINFAIGTPTVAASALTIPFTGVDGNAISATNISYTNFRSATPGSGAVAQIAKSTTQSLVVPSGASLGSVSAIATTYAIAEFNNAGAPIYGIINPLVLPLVDGIATTTLLSGLSTSAGVWYTTTALTAKAYTILGYFTATEATAGTWATAPSTVQVGPAPAVANVLPLITPWVTYTPTYTNFGTVTGSDMWSRRNGGSLEVEGKFTTGTVVASEVRMTLGYNGVNSAVTVDATKVSTILILGQWVQTGSIAPGTMILGSGLGYANFGDVGSPAAKATGSVVQNSTVQYVRFSVPITGW